MTSGQIVGKMDSQKQLNVPLDKQNMAFSSENEFGMKMPDVKKGAAFVEWYMKKFWGVQFAANWASCV